MHRAVQKETAFDIWQTAPNPPSAAQSVSMTQASPIAPVPPVSVWHTLPPHTSPEGHPPQSIGRPQPSSAAPHSSASDWQVSGVQLQSESASKVHPPGQQPSPL
jgi:hypothetical protein